VLGGRRWLDALRVETPWKKRLEAIAAALKEGDRSPLGVLRRAVRDGELPAELRDRAQALLNEAKDPVDYNLLASVAAYGATWELMHTARSLGREPEKVRSFLAKELSRRRAVWRMSWATDFPDVDSGPQSLEGTATHEATVPSDRTRAITSIGEMGTPEAYDALERIGRNRDLDRRYRLLAVHLLPKQREEARQAIIRELAQELLLEGGTRAEAAARQLTLDMPDTAAVPTAVRLLRELSEGDSARFFRQTVISNCRWRTGQLMYDRIANAVRALRELADDQALPFFLAEAKRGRKGWTAMAALGELQDVRAVAFLKEKLLEGGNNTCDRGSAICALAKMGSPAVFQALEEVLHDSTDSKTREAAIGVLAKFAGDTFSPYPRRIVLLIPEHQANTLVRPILERAAQGNLIPKKKLAWLRRRKIIDAE